MRVDNLEQQDVKKHYEVVGRLETNISKIEVRAADRDKFLVSELQSLQEQHMATQRDHRVMFPSQKRFRPKGSKQSTQARWSNSEGVIPSF